MAAVNYKKWQVVLVDLNPVKGKEMSKTRPCVIISPDVVNKHLHTVIITPLTSVIRNIPTRIASNFSGRPGEICIDQMRVIDKNRIVKVLGTLDTPERKQVSVLLGHFFSDL